MENLESKENVQFEPQTEVKMKCGRKYFIVRIYKKLLCVSHE